MSPATTPISLEVTADNSAGLNSVPCNEENLTRDVALIIDEEKDGRFKLYACGDCFPVGRAWRTRIPLALDDLFILVQDCRAVWQEVVEHAEQVPARLRGKRYVHPFQDGWNLADRSVEWLDRFGAQLAKAGRRLFNGIFGRDDPSQDPLLGEIANRLEELALKQPLIIKIISDAFFVPWGMLYNHPVRGQQLDLDGKNFSWNGFWGYRHIVEHDPKDLNLETELKVTTERLAMSINIDERIDRKLKVKCIESQLGFFKSLQNLDRRERRLKQDLAVALSATEFSDRIVYFYCHGRGAGQPDAPSLLAAGLTLSDGKEITTGDLRDWLKQRYLESQPVVFINACQGGQLTTMFYKTLAAEFLARKAVGLIGSQIDIPAVFAAEYAERFFKRFLGESAERAGPIVRDLAQDFLTNHKNPLGLVYSLYRGADCLVRWRRE